MHFFPTAHSFGYSIYVIFNLKKKKKEANRLIHRCLLPVHMGHKVDFKHALSVDFSQTEKEAKTRSGRRVAHSRSCYHSMPKCLYCLVYFFRAPWSPVRYFKRTHWLNGTPLAKIKMLSFWMSVSKSDQKTFKWPWFHRLLPEPAYLEREG